MLVLSALMLGSMHAVQFNHLRHHKHCLDEHDVEGMSARMPAWLALLTGPWFPILLHATALRHSLLSYLFGTVIVALTINIVAGLSH